MLVVIAVLFHVDRMLEGRLVRLVGSNQSLKCVTVFQDAAIREQVGRVELRNVLMQVVHFDHTDQFKFSLADISIPWISRSNLKEAVKVALIDYAEDFLRLPPESRTYEL